MNYDFLNYCKKCNQGCCRTPYKAFTSKIEREKIIKLIKKKDLNLKFENIFEKNVLNEIRNEFFYTIRKKMDGDCVFLSNSGICLINEVKPLDCRLWPFSFDYISSSKEFIFYIGNCNAVKEMKKQGLLEYYIEDSKKLMKKLIEIFNDNELIAFSKIMSVPSLKELK